MKFAEWNVCLLSILLLAGCGSGVSSLNDESEVHAFMVREKDSLTAGGSRLRKIVHHESEYETLLVSQPDWNKELSPFLALMSNPMPAGTYRVQEHEQSGKTIVEYLAADSTLPLKQLTLVKENNRIELVSAVKQVSNIYYRSTDSLTYQTGGIYRISVINQPRIGRPTRFVLTGSAEQN